MADQIYIGNFSKGLTLNRLPFNIDNDAFPYLYNFYVWRGRAKRKRGTIFLGQLERQVESVATATPPLAWQYGTITTLNGSGAGSANLISVFSLSGTIAPGSIDLSDGTNTYTESSTPNGTLVGSPSGVGTINYATGAITITGGAAGGVLIGEYSYYPSLPVMGLKDFDYSGANTEYPVLLAFDTTYAYQISQAANSASQFYGVSYYKTTNNPVVWDGGNYQQFWTTNYSGALWATNNVPGMHFVNGTYVSGSGTTAITFTFTIPGGVLAYTTLVVGDVLWFNEWGTATGVISTTISGASPQPSMSAATTVVFTVMSSSDFEVGDVVLITGLVGLDKLNNNSYPISFIADGTHITIKLPATTVFYTAYVSGGVLTSQTENSSTIDGLTGTVTAITDAATGTYVVTFAEKQTVAGTGIAQLLTNSLPDIDGIRWYDGDPTSHTGLPTGTGLGWVNFAPPLTATQVSINNLPQALYYLVGALQIVPFKDRLLFFSPYIQTSEGSPIQLQDTVIWSWNGTPYYTISDVNVPSEVPVDQTAAVNAYYVDQTGSGGWRSAGIAQPIITVSSNEDVLLVGFGGDGRKTRFVYTGNDLDPFLFFTINSELPSSATFSAISLDRGAIDMGQYGFAITDQQSSERIDLVIPDSVFQVQATNNGTQRVNSIRDFYREWIYFCYPIQTQAYADNSICVFPLQTFLFNYRDNTWSILYENFTAHGSFRPQFHKTWSTTGFKSWNVWREAWNSGAQSPQFPSIIAGNPQGYVLIKGEGLSEGRSGTIAAIATSGGNTQITSTNHCVAVGDYLLIQGCLGTTSINNLIGRVISTANANTFVIDLAFPSGTYMGLGTYTRLSQPYMQTKQFNPYWEQGKQVRLGVQKYLMDYTANGQCIVDIYLSQNPDDPWNDPVFNGVPNGLIYSQVMYTCPESANLGLTPFNTNLQMPTAQSQYQIWHRINTSLIGDTFQIGITLSDAQMRNFVTATDEITIHGMQFTIEPSSLLS